MVPAGKKNRKIAIQTKTLTADSDGYKAETWATTYTVYAWVQNMTGREFFSAQKLNAEMQTLFIIGYISGITTANKVLYDSASYDILSVVDVGEAHRELHIAAKKVTYGG